MSRGGRGVTESLKGDQGQRLLRGLSLVVSKNCIVESLIGCAVIHQLSVILNEAPLLFLPVVVHLPDKFFSLGFQGLESFCQEVGDDRVKKLFESWLVTKARIYGCKRKRCGQRVCLVFHRFLPNAFEPPTLISNFNAFHRTG